MINEKLVEISQVLPLHQPVLFMKSNQLPALNASNSLNELNLLDHKTKNKLFAIQIIQVGRSGSLV